MQNFVFRLSPPSSIFNLDQNFCSTFLRNNSEVNDQNRNPSRAKQSSTFGEQKYNSQILSSTTKMDCFVKENGFCVSSKTIQKGKTEVRNERERVRTETQRERKLKVFGRKEDTHKELSNKRIMEGNIKG